MDRPKRAEVRNPILTLPSIDAEVEEVLAAELEIVASDGNCNPREVARGALSALRSAGYVVVKAADWAEVLRLAATSIIDTRPLTAVEIERTRQLVAEQGAPFTKDPSDG